MILAAASGWADRNNAAIRDGSARLGFGKDYEITKPQV